MGWCREEKKKRADWNEKKKQNTRLEKWIDYVTLETNSNVAQQDIAGCWIRNKNDIRFTGRVGLAKIKIFLLGIRPAHHYLPQDVTGVALFKATVSIFVEI